jgi:hypothetical protein
MSRPRERVDSMSEKRRDGAWTEAARNDGVACGLPEEGAVIGAAPERIEGTREKDVRCGHPGL